MDSFTIDDFEEMRPTWKKYVLRYVDSESDLKDILGCIERCLLKGYDQSKITDRLEDYLRQKEAKKLAKKICIIAEEWIGRRRKRSRRHKKSESETESNHEGTEKENPSADGFYAKEAPAYKRVAAGSEQDGPTPDQIQQLMEHAQRQIQQRQAQIQFDKPDKLDKLSELQSRISMQMGALSGVLGLSEERERPVYVTIDKEGRTIDTRTGQVLQMESRLPTLKANIRAQRRDGTKGTASILPVEKKNVKPFMKLSPERTVSAKTAQTTQETSQHIDNRVVTRPANRIKRKAFNFVEPGKYEEMAKKMRAKERLERLQKEIEENVKKTKIIAESKYALIQQSRKSWNEVIPDIEWWDTVIIHDRSYDRLTGNPEQDSRRLFGISNLVEHPMQIKPQSTRVTEENALPVYLTKYEMKKLRRQNRAETLREQQEKIRLGLIQPPEPKVRISNLMRVLGSEAVQDPSRVENYVKTQMEKRLRAHLEANEARKLTSEQRHEKTRQKLVVDSVRQGLYACVYRILDLSDPAVKFKIEANCKQLYMTGCVVLCKEVNVVVVEGGPKQQKKYKKLMLHRIKWNDMVVCDKDGNEQRNKCALVWEGLIKDRSFSEMQFKVSPSEAFARELFRKHDVEHYWNIVLSDIILESCSV